MIKVKLGLLPQTVQETRKLLASGLKANIYFRLKTVLNKMIEDTQTYEETRIALCEKYAKVKDGKPVMTDGNYQFTDKNKEKWSTEFQELAAKDQEYDFKEIPISQAGDMVVSMFTEVFFKED